MGLFFRKKDKEIIKDARKTADRLIMEQLTNDADAHVTYLADQMRSGSPLILNFDKLHVDSANKVIAFLAGVVYAIDGHVVTIDESIILFADKSAYEDGSLEAFLKSL